MKPPRGTRLKGAIYVPTDSFVAQNDRGLDVAYHEGRTRVYEGDPILERTPSTMWVLVEDIDNSAA